jgi:hypothetical protein
MCTNPSWWTPTIDEGAERGDVRHDTLKNHAGLQLQDPLAELVKIDPQSIGVGQYQHDLSESKLSRSLDAVVEDCGQRRGC